MNIITRLLLLSCFYLFLPGILNAQEIPLHSINGLILDSLENKPINFATIKLMSKENILRTSISNADGNFVLEKIPSGRYILSFIHLGYRQYEVPIVIESSNINLPTVLLSSKVSTLEDVNIIKKKVLIDQKIDRIIYNISADPDNKTLDALSIFRKIPYLTVQSNETLLMNGSSSFKVLVNGRKSNVFNQNPADILRGMPAENIESVEVITTPGVKYDAEGVNGIINIILRKIPIGYLGKLTGRYNTPSAGPSVNNTFTLKGKKWGVTEYFAFNNRKTTPMSSEFTRELINQPLSVNQSNLLASRNNMILATAELSYEMDSLNLFTTSLNLNNYYIKHTNTRTIDIYNNSALSHYDVNNNRSLPRGLLDFDLNYQHTFKSNNLAKLTASYQYSNSFSNQRDTNIFSNQINYSMPDYVQSNNAKFVENTIQLDLTVPKRGTELEIGAKAIFRNSSSSYNTFFLNALTHQLVTTADNNFDYIQNVLGAYGSFQFQFLSAQAKIGARIENTVTEANFMNSIGTSVSQNYLTFIPSLLFQFKLGEEGKLNIGYSKSIVRPGIAMLNPFLNRNMTQNQSTGNPFLEPVVYHSIKGSYSIFKEMGFIAGLNYSFANNVIQPVFSQVNDVTKQSFANILSQNRLGVNFSLDYSLKKISSYISFNIAYARLKGDYENVNYENDGYEYSTNIDLGYAITKTFRTGINLNYVSPRVYLQQESKNFVETSLTASKSFLNRKLLLSGYINNPFKKAVNQTSEILTTDYYQWNHSYRYFRQFNISMTYNFGKLKKSIARTDKEIQNNDIATEGRL